MLFCVQQLVSQRDLRSHSNLTNLHDGNAAWQGIGNALWTMWRNLPLPHPLRKKYGGVSSKPIRTVIAVIYLGGISTMHMSIPALASIQTFNVTEAITVATSGKPNWTAIALSA